MKYDFDEMVPRRGTDSVKWDEFESDALPMWVADMDFKAAPEIIDALQRRLDHGIFGYELVPDEYYAAIVSWFRERHGWTGFGKENIVCTTGVIPAYSACIKAFTKPGEKVIVMTPCYNAFFPAIRNNKCIESHNPLIIEDGRCRIDFDDLEGKAADPQATVLLLCNPHNPTGRVWTREELLRVADICLRNGVFVISDEIHCELTYPGHDYTPFGSLPEEYVWNSASCISPTKAFNIAGIQIANIVAKDPEKVRKIDRAINDNECCDVNVFGVTALMAAYGKGGEWLDELRDYLYNNFLIVKDFIAKEIPGLQVLPLEGTYLLWLDCRAFRKEDEPEEGFSARLADHLRFNAKLILSTGTIYGPEAEGYERMNIACPKERLLAGLMHLKEGLLSY